MLRLFRNNSQCTRAWKSLSGISVYRGVRLNSNSAEIAPKTTIGESDEPQQKNDESDLSVPWYLREEITSLLVETKEIALPEIPDHAPPQVKEFLGLLARDYGLDNLMLFDMTQLPENHEFKENNKNIDFIVIATGKSEKHIYKAANELRIHLKHTYNSVPLMEGMVSSAITPSMRRRLIRRARKGPLATDNEYGKSANSWVICHHEGIDVHMLTQERREELNLESLWCKPEDAHKFLQDSYDTQESDNIFSGIRRFHTSARNYSSVTSELESFYFKLQNQPADASTEELELLLTSFNQCFLQLSIKDHQIRFQFMKTLHLLRPDLVTFGEVESALFAKYTIEESLYKDLAQEKIDDITEYAKLLIDSPFFDKYTGKVRADASLDALSRVISTLYTFSNDKFSLSANPQLVPLLWRLTYTEENQTLIGPHDVDRFIQDRTFITTSPGPLITMAGNKSRSILHLIDVHKKLEPGTAATAALRELILLTYGNAGKWDKFWDEWENIFFDKTFEPAEAVEKWTRMCVYLSMRNNKAQCLRFLENYWNNGGSVSGSAFTSLQANNEQFNSENERIAFKRAMNAILGMFETPGKVPFEGIKLYVDLL